MKILKWEQLPTAMQNESVRGYYDIIKDKEQSLFFKRMFDLIVSTIMLVLCSPVFLVLAVAIKIDSPGPVFYRQERVTQYGRRFRIHKFRTMVENADAGSKVTVNNDMRVTRVGKIIRKYRLDEVAQLIDVISGTLTLVGVRPEVTRFVEEYTNEMMATLLLPAGVTNLTCIYYKDEATLLDGVEDADRVYIEEILPAKMYYNLKGIEEFSFWRDIKILVMTVLAVLGKKYECEAVPCSEKVIEKEFVKQ